MRLDVPQDRLDFRSFIMLPFAALYWIGWRAYEMVYQLGWKKAKEPHSPVVVIGNLRVGGLGKTPLTVETARLLAKGGHQVVLSVSAYGSPASVEARLAPEGELDAAQWGDEAALLRSKLPEMPIICGRNRVRAAEICHEKFPNAVMLMDDGFQHLPLKKHVSILIDPPTWNRFVLPAGPYRQPSEDRSRADILLPDEFKLELKEYPILDAAGHPVQWERGTKVQVLCAIGRPWRFVDALEQLGFIIVKGRLLDDHAKLNLEEIQLWADPSLPILTTSKDWMKLRNQASPMPLKCWIADPVIKLADEEGFMKKLESLLEAKHH